MERSEQPLKFEYTDASVAPGITYYYKLEAIDVMGKNHFVAKASATPIAHGIPDEPKKSKEISKSSPAQGEMPNDDEKIEQDEQLLPGTTVK